MYGLPEKVFRPKPGGVHQPSTRPAAVGGRPAAMTHPPLDFTRTHTHRSDPDTSREAARKVEPRFSESCIDVLDWMALKGTKGCTYKDIVRHRMSQQRFSDLHRMDPPRIVWNGEKRDGCRVYVVKET